MTSRMKKIIVHVLRLGICIAALWFVLSGVTLHDHLVLEDGETLVGSVTEAEGSFSVLGNDGSERTVVLTEIAKNAQGQPQVSYGLKTAWRRSTKSLLLVAFLLQFPVTFIASYRLRWMLRAQKIDLAYTDCAKLTFAGNFLNFATPLGSNGGDVFKAYFVTKHTDRKTEAVTTIFLDRVIGLGTMVLCVALIASFAGGSSRLAEFRPYVLTMLGVGVVCFLAYGSAWVRKNLIPWSWLERLPAYEQIRRIDRTARSLISQRKILLVAVGLTVMLQMTCLTGYFFVATALSFDAHIGNMLEYFAYFFAATVIQALPGPPQGLGTVELAYSFFLAPYGGPSQILCFAFIIRLSVLFAALPGLIVALTGSYKPRSVVLPIDDAEGDERNPSESEPDLVTTGGSGP